MAFWPSRASKTEASPALLLCSFCGKTQREVRKLIAGPSVYICDGCIGLCNDIVVEEETKRPIDPLAFGRDGLLGALERAGGHPLATRRRIVEALLTLAADDAAACRDVANAASAAADYGGALRAWGAVPASARTAADAIDEACMHDWLGDASSATAALDAIDDATMSMLDRAIVPLHRALFRFTGGEVDRAEAERHAATVETFRAQLPSLSLTDASRRGLEREARLVEAHAARSLGHLVRTEALLREHLLSHERDVLAWALLFEVHAMQGQTEHAEAARKKALQLVEPTSPIAERLRARSTGPFR